MGSHAKAHPSSLLLLTALRDGLCTQATSKTPAKTPRLCVNHTAVQSHHTHNHKDLTAVEDWFSVCSIAAWRGCLSQWAKQREETVKLYTKACSLSVCGWAVQGHWFTTLAGPFEGMTCHLEHMNNRAARPLCVHPVHFTDFFTVLRSNHY